MTTLTRGEAGRINIQHAQAVHAARRAERLEDVSWMADTGECLSGAAKRLGIGVAALERWCARYAPELRQVLMSREPVGHSSERRAS